MYMYSERGAFRDLAGLRLTVAAGTAPRRTLDDGVVVPENPKHWRVRAPCVM